MDKEEEEKHREFLSIFGLEGEELDEKIELLKLFKKTHNVGGKEKREEENDKPRYYSSIHTKSDIENRYKKAKEAEEIESKNNEIKRLTERVKSLLKQNDELEEELEEAESQIKIEKKNRVKNPKRPSQDDVEMTRFRFSVVEVETEKDITWELPIFLN